MLINILLWIIFFCYWFYKSRNVKQTQSKEPLSSRIFHLSCIVLVMVFFMAPLSDVPILGTRFLPDEQHPWFFGTQLIDLILTASGISLAIWARIHLGQYWSGRATLLKGHKLIQTGPYRWVRHPIYSGMICALLGTALALGQVRGLLAVLVLSASYIRKLLIEETMLTGQFGDDYRKFKTRTNALFPFLF